MGCTAGPSLRVRPVGRTEGFPNKEGREKDQAGVWAEMEVVSSSNNRTEMAEAKGVCL